MRCSLCGCDEAENHFNGLCEPCLDLYKIANDINAYSMKHYNYELAQALYLSKIDNNISNTYFIKKRNILFELINNEKQNFAIQQKKRRLHLIDEIKLEE